MRSIAPPAAVVDDRDLLGEGPWWDDRTATLVRVDIRAHEVRRWSPARGVLPPRTYPAEVSLALPCLAGGLVLAQVDHLLLDDGESIERLCEIDADNPHTRLNDGVCDAQGNLWVGTYSTRGEPEAALHVVRPDGSVSVAVDGLTASNGVDWSPDRSMLYAVDTGAATVTRHEVAPGTTTVVRSEVIVAFDPDRGRPDGLTVDREGGIWVAAWGGGCVERYLPDGTLSGSLAVPVTYPTAVALGGPDLRALFVTTSRHHLPADAVEPAAGSVLSTRVPTGGLPTMTFGTDRP